MSRDAFTPLQSLQSTVDPRIQGLEAWEYEYSNTETEVCN